MAQSLTLTVIDSGEKVDLVRPVLEIEYQLDRHERLTMQVDTVWCDDCQRFGNGECIRTEEELQRELSDLDDEKSEIHRMFLQLISFPPHRADALRKLKVELERRIEWRRKRESPPKCLSCGGTQLKPIPIGRRVPHPGMPGASVILEVRGFASIAVAHPCYTPEGEPIPNPPRKPSVPENWHPPQMKNEKKPWWRFGW